MIQTLRQCDEERVLLSSSPAETFSIGLGLGRLLMPGDFIGLTGELGVGKTQLVRGLAAGAEVPEAEVASPSFPVVYPYRGRFQFYHADFYRLANYDELYSTGFTDLPGENSVVVVEWLDRIPSAAPLDLLWIHLRFAPTSPETTRRIDARAFGARHAELLRRWVAAEQ